MTVGLLRAGKLLVEPVVARVVSTSEDLLGLPVYESKRCSGRVLAGGGLFIKVCVEIGITPAVLVRGEA